MCFMLLYDYHDDEHMYFLSVFRRVWWANFQISVLFANFLVYWCLMVAQAQAPANEGMNDPWKNILYL